MRVSPMQIQRIAEMVLLKWKQNNILTLKADEKAVLASAVKALQADYQKELNLDRDVQKMLDDLERTNGGEFQRHKMQIMLKQKLAKEKKVIL